MKKQFLILFFGLSSLLSIGQSWDWGRTEYNPLNSSGNNVFSVVTDRDGNAYIAGNYEDLIAFGDDTLKGNEVTAYLAKYNSLGSILWAVQPTDSMNSYSIGECLAVDKYNNIYMCGQFGGAVKFGSFYIRAIGLGSFLVKYSSTGNVLWIRQSTIPSPNSNASAQSVAVDDSGNVYITGSFADSIQFGAITLNATHFADRSLFLAKFDSTGNVKWATQSFSPQSSNGISTSSVSIDKTDNIYITGGFYDTISFGPFRLTSSINNSVFLAKYTSSGTALWAKQSINNTHFSNAEANASITDKANNIYITGSFSDTVLFGLNPINSHNALSVFLIKYDSMGNVIWTKQSSPNWLGSFLTIDASNRIYLAGTSLFKENPDSLIVGRLKFYTNPNDSLASFLLKFDTTGKPICGSILDNVWINGENGGVATDSTGNYVYMAGTYGDYLVTCGPDTFFAYGQAMDIFLGRWLNCAVDAGINSISSPTSSVSVFPNPNKGIFNIGIRNKEQGISETKIEIYNVLGEKIYDAPLPSQTNNTIDLSGRPNGVYLYRVVTEDGSLVGDGKIVIAR